MVTLDFETHVVIQDQLCYKGAMPGSSTPSITLSRFGEVMHDFAKSNFSASNAFLGVRVKSTGELREFLHGFYTAVKKHALIKR